MSYREVHVIEVKEVVRLWSLGESQRSMARLTGLDRKTVHRYVQAAQESGGRPGEPVSEALVGEVIGRVRAQGPGVRGSSWSVCSAHRERLAGWLEESIPLSKVQELLSRHTGVKVPYRTLHRYAVKELGLGGRRTTVRLAEGQPGEELQIDFGAVGFLCEEGRRRRVWALVLTAVVSRHLFVWLTYQQSVTDVVAGCEAAWKFFGGVFRVLIPDNLKAIVVKADRDCPRLNAAFQEYSQERGFVVAVLDAGPSAGGGRAVVPDDGGPAPARDDAAAPGRALRARGAAAPVAGSGAALRGGGLERGAGSARSSCDGGQGFVLVADGLHRRAGAGA
jgi:hypothetical protein